jgi:hypothetical protein
MRSILSKLVAGTAVAGAALLVSACSSNTNTTTNVTETNYVESEMTNTVSDEMTAIDAANGADSMMANDTMGNAMGNAL